MPVWYLALYPWSSSLRRTSYALALSLCLSAILQCVHCDAINTTHPLAANNKPRTSCSSQPVFRRPPVCLRSYTWRPTLALALALGLALLPLAPVEARVNELHMSPLRCAAPAPPLHACHMHAIPSPLLLILFRRRLCTKSSLGFLATAGY